MPLFKGQGCKSTPRKAIQYITDEKKAEIVSSQNLDDSRSYAQQFRETARLYGKGDRFEERKYYHFKLSCDRADGVSAADHHEYAEALAKKLFPGYECVIATHSDTDTAHSHIIVNAVSFETGKKLDIRNAAYGRMKDAANDLGAERGFTTLDFRKPARERITTQERLVELKGGTSWKEELREVIRLAKQDTKTMPEFEKYLNEYGVELTRNTAKTIAYKHPKKEKAIRGEKLGSDYTKGAVIDELEQNRRLDSQRTVAAESRAETNRDREYAVEGSVGAVERKVRGIAEGVRRLTSDGRAELAAKAEAERRAAQEAAERAEQERQRKLEQDQREREQTQRRKSRTIDHDFGPSL